MLSLMRSMELDFHRGLQEHLLEVDCCLMMLMVLEGFGLMLMLCSDWVGWAVVHLDHLHLGSDVCRLL